VVRLLFFVESVAWFNRGSSRLQRSGDDSNDSGKDREQNDPPDDGLLNYQKCYMIMILP